MSIKVRYFASLKEIAGCSERHLDISTPLSAKAVWGQCSNDKALPDNILVAINMEYAGWDSMVADGDEVAFFPPVTGGCR